MAMSTNDVRFTPRKRTLHCTAANVRFVPEADVSSNSQLFDHLIGGGYDRQRKFYAEWS
jgi:hypothetical protein